jgi:hypothetical protein
MNIDDLFKDRPPDEILFPFGSPGTPQAVVYRQMTDVIEMLMRLGLAEVAIMQFISLCDEKGSKRRIDEPVSISQSFRDVEVEGRFAYGFYSFQRPKKGPIEALLVFGVAPIGMEGLFKLKMDLYRDRFFAALKQHSRLSFKLENILSEPNN